MKLSQKTIKQFQQFIFDWWVDYRRDLPWRRTRDPYKILVSEIMLQQTQVSRVLPKYTEFLAAFPNVRALAAASPAHVLRVWQGMGYNRRALYLRNAAKIVVQQHAGQFPKDELLLRKLPGLGMYTARAVLVFAYEQDVAMVDTNIRQIITHFFFADVSQKESVIGEIADQLVPKGKSWVWHQALMDYGALRLSLGKSRDRSGQALKATKRHIPFKETNRYFRGRIMDALRQKQYPNRQLLDELVTLYHKDQVFFKALLSTLAREGLVSITEDGYSLPV